MKKTKLFLLLGFLSLIISCTFRNKANIVEEKLSVYLGLDYKKNRKEIITIWINDTIAFSSNYYSIDSLGSLVSWPTNIASITKKVDSIKVRIQINNLDTTFYHSPKESVDTTFYYNIKNINKLGIGYLKAYHGFIIYDSNDKDWWKVE